MKKKISVFALLFSLMLALVVPIHAKADVNVVIPAGKYEFNNSLVDCDSLSKSYDLNPVRLYKLNKNTWFRVDDQGVSLKGTSFEYYVNDGYWTTKGLSSDYGVNMTRYFELTKDLTVPSEFYDWLCKNVVDEFGYPLGYDPYDLIDWCIDAGLNCVPSSNEIEDTYSFEFDFSNWYIIRKNRISGSEYVWYLSQIPKPDDTILYVTNRALADSTIGAYNFALGSGDTGYVSSVVNVENFVYDSSGGGWLFTERVSTDLGFTNPYNMDDIGISFGSSMPILYTSIDIYFDMNQNDVFMATSTAFEDNTTTIAPTVAPTPTTAPGSSGSGRPGSGTRPDTGGQATGGGGLDFIINLFTMIWTKICSIPMAVDGYSISLQQIIVYGALVSIVGGFIMHFIFGRK